MQFRYGLVAAWIVATFASMLVAFAAVGSVRSAIEDPPAALLLPQDAPSTISLPSASSTLETTIPDPEVDEGAPVASPDSRPAGVEGVLEEDTDVSEPPSTTQAPPATAAAPPGTSTTTTVTTSSPSTTMPATSQIETYETAGGWVTVRADGQGVFLESASPKPGWTVKTEGSGPEHFTVVFKGGGDEIHVAVAYENGAIDVDIEE